MPQSPNDWPPSTNPYRDYVVAKDGKHPVAEKPAEGSVGIVIPVHNGLKFFKLCFHSVLAFTNHPYLLAIVDNLSNAQTRQYFHSCHNNHQVYWLRYDEDFNFAAEVNMGLRKLFSFPEVKFGLILNADTVVTPLWLDKMVKAINTHEKIGAVGPITNIANPEQMEQQRVNDLTVSQRVSGMCMLIRKEAFEEVGGFDEEFTSGGFEDWDFCERIRRNGWHVMIDGFTYIHHFYKMFRRDDYNEAMKKNEDLFFKKHPHLEEMVVRSKS